MIEKFPDDFKFVHKDLGIQNADVIRLVSKKCEEVMLDCETTINSNPSRPNMNIEVHKNLLANHQNAFAIDRAVDQFVGYEEIKSRESSPPKASTNNSDGNNITGNSVGYTSDANVLIAMSEPTENMAMCWKCGDKGHYKNECPLLFKQERDDFCARRAASRAKETDDSGIDKVMTAVLVYL